eukprot:c28093_g2_i1 orf=409-2775(-)
MELAISDRVGVNLVLFDSTNKSVWQSTDYPSDTLTYGQSLGHSLVSNSTTQRLTSWASRTNATDGIYSLEVESSGLVLYASFPVRMPYWMWVPDPLNCPAKVATLTNVSCTKGSGIVFINLDFLGVNCWVGNLSVGMVPFTCLSFASTGSDDLVNMTILKVYSDGNLRAQTLQYSASEVTHRVTLLDVFSLTQCSLPLRCGPYSICTGTSSPQCECPSNSTLFRPVDMSDSTQGCELTQPLLSTCHSKERSLSNGSTVTPQQMMHRLEGIDYFFNAFSSSIPQFQTEEDCSNGCLQNCSCLAAFWYAHTLDCYYVDQMGSLQGADNQSFVGFLKVNPFLDQGSDKTNMSADLGSDKTNASAGLIAAIVVSAAAASLVLVCSLFYFIARRRRRYYERQQIDAAEDVLDAIPGLPTRFSFTELHDITKGFSSKLGKGGFGAVYRGLLPDGTTVAVKQLESVSQGDKEFRSEVVIMASVHHFNLLHLKGFCAQGAHRLLVYEFMENGSLDQWLFKRASAYNECYGEEKKPEKNSPLPWDLRFKIALGTARGLAYLHDECRERILHLDIKPQNILLDEEFVPKVADFGLSRLMDRDKSVVVTTMRGTPGYLAPEWLKEAGSIDVKCDVFSFGMLLMEVVSGRKNSDHSVNQPEQIYYPEWAYQQIVSFAHHKGLSLADELTGAKLESEKERAQLMSLITTAFLCVVDKPEWRPSMAQVVKMLEAGTYGEPLEAVQVLRQHEPRLVFVLMSGRRDSNVSGDHASNAQSITNKCSSNDSVVPLSWFADSYNIGR